MTADLLIRNANLPDGRSGQDLLIHEGRIVEVRPAIAVEAREVIDAGGLLVTPPFVDAHFHLDSVLSLGRPRLNESGTLLEGIRIWGELRPTLTVEEVVERALRYCDLAVAQGIGAIRSHVDVTDDRLVGVEALLEVKRRVAPYLTIQLVAFPQDGLYRYPNGRANLLRALDQGVEVVGGIPHHERTMEDGRRSVVELCTLAAERGLRVDLHCDETDDPASRHIETLVAETRRLGLSGRVAGSHLTSMHGMDNYYVSKLLPLMAEAGVAAIPNPLINLWLQGRHDAYPKRRGLARIAEMWAHDIRVAFGHDCIMDPWYPLGSGDMLEVAKMAIHAAHLTSRSQMRAAFDAVTSVPAAILGLEGYGLEPGCRADLVLLEASDPIEAIRLQAARLLVLRAGRVVARGASRKTALELPGRPRELAPHRLGAGAG
ncbi:MAG: amidohydrolase family protein [Geminicoccaceae bacterium]|nr:amidohydrolase family protein [Geminicoccaceae bacterium]